MDTRPMPESKVVTAAHDYAQQGWSVIPVEPQSKKPRLKAWPNLRISLAEISDYFHDHDNVGVLLGEPSGGLVDVDLDCLEALRLADAFLPATPLIHGRKSKPASHRWYFVATPPEKTQKYSDFSGASLLELRSTGSQTVVPPSIHESGEEIVWESKGKPAHVEIESLAVAVSKAAAAALLARNWPSPGSRHQVALALAGMLLRSKWSEEDTAHFIEAVAIAAGDEEARQRARCVRSTAMRLACGGEVTGGKILASIVGDDVVSRIRAWLSLNKSSDVSPISSAVGGGAELAAAIRGVALNRDTPPFDKRREIANLVRRELSGRGNFLRTSDGRAFFFDSHDRRLYDLDQSAFRYLLTGISGLAATETFFKFTLDLLVANANREARLADVHSFAHFNSDSGTLAVSDGTVGVWVRERGGKWCLRNNGDDDLLFLTDSNATPWEPDFSKSGDSLQWFFSQFMFAGSQLTAAEYRTLLGVYLAQQFFPALRKTRMIPAFLGPQGSGKTTAMRLLGRLLVGPEFDVTGLQRDREDAFVAAVCNRLILGLDNADSKIPFLPDALACYATSQRYQLRKLYTTNEEVSFSPRAILMISSRDPQFNRPDVAERLLPFNFARPRKHKPEFEIFAELEKRRCAIMGFLLIGAGEIVDALSKYPARALSFRMADFASFGERVSAMDGKSTQWVDLLVRLEKAQTEFASADDGLVDALRILLSRDRVSEMSVTELFKACKEIADLHGFMFPRSCQSFGRRLSSTCRVIEIELGVRFQESRGHGGQRIISLTTSKESEGDEGDESEQIETKEGVRDRA